MFLVLRKKFLFYQCSTKAYGCMWFCNWYHFELSVHFKSSLNFVVGKICESWGLSTFFELFWRWLRKNTDFTRWVSVAGNMYQIPKRIVIFARKWRCMLCTVITGIINYFVTKHSSPRAFRTFSTIRLVINDLKWTRSSHLNVYLDLKRRLSTVVLGVNWVFFFILWSNLFEIWSTHSTTLISMNIWSSGKVDVLVKRFSYLILQPCSRQALPMSL